MSRPEWFDTEELREWYDSRPIPVQEVLQQINPRVAYQVIKAPVFPYKLHSVQEHGTGQEPTLTMDKMAPGREYRVFGYRVKDLRLFVPGENGAATMETLEAWGVEW